MPLHSLVFCPHGVISFRGCEHPEYGSSSFASSAPDTEFGEKKQHQAQGLLRQHHGQAGLPCIPWQAQMLESCGLHSARGSDATARWLWVSLEESVLLQRGCGWLQGSSRVPCSKPMAEGQAGDPAFVHRLPAVYPALCTTIQALKSVQPSKSSLALGLSLPSALAHKLPSL